MLTDFQRRVAKLLLEAIHSLDFALGGGQALGVHGIIDRPSKDLDGYSPSMEATTYALAESAALKALADAGLVATVIQELDWLRVIKVEDPDTDDQVIIDLAYDQRTHPPVIIKDLGAVIDIEDVVYGKVRALVERGAERDFVDFDAILRDGRWNVVGLYERISPNFPDVLPDKNAFADLLTEVKELDDVELLGAGLTPADIVALQQRLLAARDTLLGT